MNYNWNENFVGLGQSLGIKGTDHPLGKVKWT